ncbi:helix-turn-helix transcriptional regulator [Mesorhizobium argentiipisi]|uniref:Helix-turn-helix transcriptional regulator n=1 Tax=Mesorhizobium argentiipisi TaxID=3015175 RepID=A0ABU8KND8_9HYPH
MANIDVPLEDLRLFGTIIAKLENARTRQEIYEVAAADISRLAGAIRVSLSSVLDQRERLELHAEVSEKSRTGGDDLEIWHLSDGSPSRVRRLRQCVCLSLDNGGTTLGTLRLWHHRGRAFSSSMITMIAAVVPYLCAALTRCARSPGRLSSRELDVATLVARGMRDREIAEALGITFSTVRTHLNHALARLGCTNRTELAALIIRAARPLHGGARFENAA